MKDFLCFGVSWRSRWCVLDLLTRCKLKPICKAHDRHLNRSVDEDDMTAPQFRALRDHGIPATIKPGPRPIVTINQPSTYATGTTSNVTWRISEEL